MTHVDMAAVVDAVEEVCDHTIRLADSLSEDQGALATDCPGWSVKDHLAHMVGLEQVLGGAPHPHIDLPKLDHVESDIDVYMEQQVHVRRPLALRSIVDEFVGMLPRRIEQLRTLADEGDPDVDAPLGRTRKLSRSLPIRVFDLWAHEQDIRRAIGVPPRLDGVSGAMVLDRVLGAWAAILPEALDGHDLSLRIEVKSRAEAKTINVGEGGPTATISADAGVLARLGCGRGQVMAVLAEAEIKGDMAVVDTVAPHLAFTP